MQLLHWMPKQKHTQLPCSKIKIAIAFVTCGGFALLSLPPSLPLSLQHWHPGYFHAALHNWSLSR